MVNILVEAPSRLRFTVASAAFVAAAPSAEYVFATTTWLQNVEMQCHAMPCL